GERRLVGGVERYRHRGPRGPDALFPGVRARSLGSEPAGRTRRGTQLTAQRVAADPQPPGGRPHWPPRRIRRVLLRRRRERRDSRPLIRTVVSRRQRRLLEGQHGVVPGDRLLLNSPPLRTLRTRR